MHRISALALVTLAACAVSPDALQTAATTRNAWSALETVRAGAHSAELAHWWQSFGDPTLDALIQRATAANRDLHSAAARIRAARAQLAASPEDEGRAGFDAVWEADVLARPTHAELEERRDLLVVLLGDVARTYVELRAQQRFSALQIDDVTAAHGVLERTQARLAAGSASASDVARARAMLASAESLATEADRAARRALLRLGILLGEDAGALDDALSTGGAIPTPPARVAAGLPSDLLARRADVRRAERRLAAKAARAGVATADVYPSFSLLGGLGFESVDLSDLSSAESRAWSAGLAAHWPKFDGSRRQANLALAGAHAEPELVAYERTFLLALEEVESALDAYAREWERRRSLEVAAGARARTVARARELVGAGRADVLGVLEAERGLYATQRELAESDAAVATHAVALYKGLAGGFETEL